MARFTRVEPDVVARERSLVLEEEGWTLGVL